jgi:hypothetical protein
VPSSASPCALHLECRSAVAQPNTPLLKSHHHLRTILDLASSSLTVVIFMNGWKGCSGNAALQRVACGIQAFLLFLRLLYFSMADARMGAFFR